MLTAPPRQRLFKRDAATHKRGRVDTPFSDRVADCCELGRGVGEAAGE